MRGHHGYREIADRLRQRIAVGRRFRLAAGFPARRRLPQSSASHAELRGPRSSRSRLTVWLGSSPAEGGSSLARRALTAESASYERVAAHVRSLIKRGRRKAGAPLPSEKELCDELGVSRNTVRRAYELLVDEGLVVRRQGVGAFVADVKS